MPPSWDLQLPRCAPAAAQPFQVPDALWDTLACIPALVRLEVAVQADVGGTTIGGHAWRCLAACTQLSGLKLLDADVARGCGFGEQQVGAAAVVLL